jgi:hypothetical protein
MPSTLTSADKPRIGKQLTRVLAFMLEQGDRWCSLRFIAEGLRRKHGTLFPEASVSARLRELRANGYEVSRKRSTATSGLHVYRVTSSQKELF